MSDIFESMQANGWLAPSQQSYRFENQVVIGDVRGQMGALIQQAGLDQHVVAVVCDEHIVGVLASDVAKACSVDLVILPDGVKPTMQVIGKLVEQLKREQVSYVVAVGSGTINDIAKMASFILGVDYGVCGTAPSMNGYMSANASVIEAGVRVSKAAHMPSFAWMDVDVMMHAPTYLIQSGVGDALCRSTAQADWLLSHVMLGTSYQKDVFDMQMPYESLVFGDVRRLLKRDEQAMIALVKLLLLSGYGMTITGHSSPASGAEHMIAHLMDMAGYNDINGLTHGIQIAVTTCTMARIQREVLTKISGLVVCMPAFDDHGLQKLLSKEQVDACKQAYGVKKKAYDEFQDKGLSCEEISAIEQSMVSVDQLQEICNQIGLGTKPEAIGWSKEVYEDAIKLSRFTRNRWTFLDVL